MNNDVERGIAIASVYFTIVVGAIAVLAWFEIGPLRWAGADSEAAPAASSNLPASTVVGTGSSGEEPSDPTTTSSEPTTSREPTTTPPPPPSTTVAPIPEILINPDRVAEETTPEIAVSGTGWGAGTRLRVAFCREAMSSIFYDSTLVGCQALKDVHADESGAFTATVGPLDRNDTLFPRTTFIVAYEPDRDPYERLTADAPLLVYE